jgi:hypothetical protein
MSAATIDLLIEKGATYEKIFYYKDNTRTPIDLTDYTARMQVRSTFRSTVVILDLTTENGGIVITPAEGKIVINITDTATSAIVGSKGVYDLELISGTSVITKLIRGTVKMPDEVTR